MEVPLGNANNPPYAETLQEYCMADVMHTHDLVNMDLAAVELRANNPQYTGMRTEVLTIQDLEE